MIDRRDRVLPHLGLRNPRTEVPGDRPHVPVQQLVPGLRKRGRQLVRMFVKPLRDRPIDRIHLQRQVRRQHRGRVPLRRVVGIRHRALGLGILGRPLEGAGGALGQLPFIVEQVVQEPMAPLRRGVGPGALEAAGDRVAALAAAEAVLPAKALQLESLSGEEILAARRGRSSETKIDAALRFARTVFVNRGQVSEADVDHASLLHFRHCLALRVRKVAPQ